MWPAIEPKSHFCRDSSGEKVEIANRKCSKAKKREKAKKKIHHSHSLARQVERTRAHIEKKFGNLKPEQVDGEVLRALPPFEQPFGDTTSAPTFPPNFMQQTKATSHSPRIAFDDNMAAGSDENRNPGPRFQHEQLLRNLTPEAATKTASALLYGDTFTTGAKVREQELTEKWGVAPYEEVAVIIEIIVNALSSVKWCEATAQSGLLDQWLNEPEPRDPSKPSHVFWNEKIRVSKLTGAELRREQQEAEKVYESMMQARKATAQA